MAVSFQSRYYGKRPRLQKKRCNLPRAFEAQDLGGELRRRAGEVGPASWGCQDSSQLAVVSARARAEADNAETPRGLGFCPCYCPQLTLRVYLEPQVPVISREDA